MINTMYMARKWVEDTSRSKFTETRNQLKKNIDNSHQSVHQRNKSQVANVKNEKKMLDDLKSFNR